MKIVLIGLGSIGVRHLRNLLSLGYRQITVISRAGILPAEFNFLTVHTSLSGALSSSSFDAAIICTPTSHHVASVTALLQAKIPNIYIEKPVSHSLADMDKLLALAGLYENNIVVGFDLHFDPGMQKIKQLIAENIVGKVVSINAQVGQYLPDWRPAEDYSKGMSAKKETGGGVMLDLVHEFDYLLWLAGSVKLLACQYSHTGALAIETEDVCDVLLRFTNGATATIHLDYLQRKLVRNCLVTGHNGSIFWDLTQSKVSWIDASKVESQFEYTSFERNDRFLQIMQAFLENKKDSRLTTLQQGIKSLELVMAAKSSAEKKRFYTDGGIQLYKSIKMILATICCRGGSKGVPGKNIRELKGKPLIAYTIDAANKSTKINSVIVSTDDEKIVSIARQYGAAVPFIRPADLATDSSSKWPVFIHAVETFEKLTGETVDYLVDLDVTVPLKTAADIDGAIELALSNTSADVIITGYEPERNPYFNMMEVGKNGYASIVKQSERPIVRRQDAPEIYSLTPAAYVVKKSALYEFEHWSKARCKIHPIPRERAVDIDTEIDFKIVEFLMNHN